MAVTGRHKCRRQAAARNELRDWAARSLTPGPPLPKRERGVVVGRPPRLLPTALRLLPSAMKKSSVAQARRRETPARK